MRVEYKRLNHDPSVPLSQDGNIQLLNEIIMDQAKILTDVINGTNIEDIPQTWCLCKWTSSRHGIFDLTHGYR